MLLHQWYQSPVVFWPAGGVVVPGAPVNIDAPIISGSGVQGSNLVCDENFWTGTEPLTYEYQWYYREPDVPDAPSNSGLPALTGSAYVTATLHCNPGTWSGTAPIVYHYQWKRGATDIGSDSSSYTVVTGDLTAVISCVVTAVNDVGSVDATSSNTKGPIVEAPPAELLIDEEGETLTTDGEDLTVIDDA